MTRASCLYEGMVRHRRFEPVEHGFHTRIQLLYLDLEELDHVFEGSRLWSAESATPVSFRRSDHLGPVTEPLAASVCSLVEARLGRSPTGPIRLLTSPRHLGLVFNPVSLFYCFEADGDRLDALVAEVTNTPWGERHCYVLDLRGAHAGRGAREARDARGEVVEYRHEKAFHVSPFMAMDMRYDWRVGRPGRALTLSIRNERLDGSRSPRRRDRAPYFQADLALHRREIDAASLRRAFWREPFLSARILLAIYGQALRLFLKRVPFVPHPPQRWPRALSDPALLSGEAKPMSEVCRG